MRIVCSFVLLGIGLLLLTGCYSVPANSDIPWNAPQGWEGSPYIPGFSE